VWIEIADDGCGLRDDAAAPRGGGGRGLRNMRRRAAEIDGAIDVSSDASGTRVRLSLPLLPR
jgi:signal transduction histidine kinase